MHFRAGGVIAGRASSGCSPSPAPLPHPRRQRGASNYASARRPPPPPSTLLATALKVCQGRSARTEGGCPVRGPIFLRETTARSGVCAACGMRRHTSVASASASIQVNIRPSRRLRRASAGRRGADGPPEKMRTDRVRRTPGARSKPCRGSACSRDDAVVKGAP